MRYSEKNIDMLTGSLYRSMLFFTIPIALSSMLQQLFNAADTAIVGLFDTSSSLAAVGTNGEIIALIVALSSGLSVGVNVLVAQQIGQLYRCRKILRICLVFSIVSSLILIEPLVIFRNFFAGFPADLCRRECAPVSPDLFRTGGDAALPGSRLSRCRQLPVRRASRGAPLCAGADGRKRGCGPNRPRRSAGGRERISAQC